MHGLSPFSNKFAIKFWQNCTCSRASVSGSTDSSGLSSFRILFVLYLCKCVIFNMSYLLIPIVQTYWFVCVTIFDSRFSFY